MFLFEFLLPLGRVCVKGIDSTLANFAAKMTRACGRIDLSATRSR